METVQNKTHPLFLVAAGALTLASGTATAHFAGWLPQPSAQATPPAIVADAPAETKAPAKAPVARKAAPKPAVRAQVAAPSPRSEARATPVSYRTASAPVCTSCGTVESIREVTGPGRASGLGAVAGGVLGGVLGNQVGGGNGKKLATVVGIVGGAFAGHHIEQNMQSEKRYEVSVRMDDGSRRVLQQEAAPLWQVGERVRLGNSGPASTI